jgi:hypothetical protein
MFISIRGGICQYLDEFLSKYRAVRQILLEKMLFYHRMEAEGYFIEGSDDEGESGYFQEKRK